MLIDIVQSGLLFVILIFDCVLGDVIPLPVPVRFIDNAPAIGEVPANNTFGAFVLANVDAIPSPARELFVSSSSIAWQMLGYAAFFSVEEGKAQLYVAQKRQFIAGSAVANNNPLAGGNLFNYSTNMHTERQLTIAVLEQQRISIPIATAAGSVIRGAMDVPSMPDENVLIGVQGLRGGSLHIYTIQNPCQNAATDNGNFSCINYYNNLAGFIPNINFDIYFLRVNMRLNRDFITQTLGAFDALCNFVQENPVGHFRIENGWLQYNNVRTNVWKNLVQQNPLGGWHTAAAIANGNVYILVKEINNLLAKKAFSNLQIDKMFNSIHNIGNISNLRYHAI